jgi:hypothetical protein
VQDYLPEPIYVICSYCTRLRGNHQQTHKIFIPRHSINTYHLSNEATGLLEVPTELCEIFYLKMQHLMEVCWKEIRSTANLDAVHFSYQRLTIRTFCGLNRTRTDKKQAARPLAKRETGRSAAEGVDAESRR